ncbi:EHD1 [Mytilus coruscus]|uniref:EHD1 n=1 Tax=Mytilus coruscus TaxID=42192 RepID=A0A6J8A9V8_MYTCO|nr:EHD1 [Mytilus coruscus]
MNFISRKKETTYNLRKHCRKAVAMNRIDEREKIMKANIKSKNLFYRLIKKQRGRLSNHIDELSVGDTVYSTEDNILIGWKHHFENLTKNSIHEHFDCKYQQKIEQEYIDIIDICRAMFQHQSITKNEIEEALKLLNLNKSADLFGISTENLLYGGQSLIYHLKELLDKQDFPGIRIGPEPTTDRFIAVMSGDQDGIVPGNALVVDSKKQFKPLTKFGNAFLNRFQCSTLNNPVVDSLTIVDTPGILSGEKQRLDRGYDFAGVLEWQFKRAIDAVKGYDDKIRIILNKADMVDHQQLMRVYGALMWSLGKVLNTPEVARVYIGSFWDQPLHFDMNRKLFELEEQDLFNDLQSLPKNAALRKLNDLIKRARLAKVIISDLNQSRI